MTHFDRSDLQQLSPEYVGKLPQERVIVLFELLRQDLIRAQDRLNQNPSNSSRPPSTRAPWEREPDNDDADNEQSAEPECCKGCAKLFESSGLLYVDETSWKEHKVTRWLWVAVGDQVVYFTVGPRTEEIAQKIIGESYPGDLMTDEKRFIYPFGGRSKW